MEKVLGGSTRSWVNQSRKLERPLSNGKGDDGEECSLKRGPFYRCGRWKEERVSCGVMDFFQRWVVSLLKRNEMASMTSLSTKLKPQPNPFSTSRQGSVDPFTCYVVVVAVVLDNLGALVPASTVVTPVAPLYRSCHVIVPSFDPKKLPLFSFFCFLYPLFARQFHFCPLRYKRNRRPIRICSKQSRRFLSSVAPAFSSGTSWSTNRSRSSF